MLKKLLLISLSGFFVSQSLFADVAGRNDIDICAFPRDAFDERVANAAFTLKFKEAPKPEELQNILASLSFPEVKFRKLIPASDGNYSLYFHFIRPANGCNMEHFRSFRKEESVNLMSYIKSRLFGLEDIRLNGPIPYLDSLVEN